MPPIPGRDIVSIVVHGDSMMPIYENGTVLYYENGYGAPTDDLVNRNCIVTLEDGRTLVRRLHRGPEPGTWNLVAPNGSVLISQRVAHAHRIIWTKPA